MDPEIKNAIIETLSVVRANFSDPLGGRYPLERITSAAVSALGAWQEAGNAVKRHYQTLTRLSQDEERRNKEPTAVPVGKAPALADDQERA